MKAKRALMMTVVALVAATMSLGWTVQVKASEPAKEDQSWRYHDIVTLDFVKEHVKIPPSEDVMIIDSRPYKPKYIKGHIPTAVSLPDSQFDELTERLPENKENLLIFYCGGLKCKLSHKSAYKAEALGYKNVKVFAEGFPGWMKDPKNYAEVSVEYVAEQIDANQMVLVDARPYKPKFVKGHVPTAVSIPDSQFDELKGKLPIDKDTQLIFYCGGFKCPLSDKSARKAIDLGYTNVKVFAAGYPEWVKFAGTPANNLQTASAQIKQGKDEGSIDIESFKNIVDNGVEKVLLVDVRDSDEYKSGAFKTAVNIPVDQLEAKMKSFPTDKPIIFVCNTGARSGEAYYMVKDLRPELKEVYYLEAELTINKDGSYKVKQTP
jgi:rhodanese-related sulfurtransferase